MMMKIATGLCFLALVANSHAGPTLFEQMGGAEKLHAVVDDFMAVIEDDDRINFTFAEANIDKFKKLLYEQLCELSQGPCKYTGRTMEESHRKLMIDDNMFNALAEDLYIAFERQHVPYHVQNRMMALLAPMQKDIVKSRAMRATVKPPR